MRLRRLLPMTLLAIALLMLAAAEARGGTYVVRECHHAAPQNHFHEAIVDTFPSPSPYSVAAGPGTCANAGSDYSIAIRPQSGALDGQYGLARFLAPEGTELIGVELDARLRGEAGHRARLSMANAAGIEQVRIAAGGSGPTGFERYRWPAGSPGTNGYGQFTAGLVCDNPGYGCPLTNDGDKSKVDIRNLKFTLRDEVAPTVELAKELVGGGWISGSAEVGATASDVGAGLHLLGILVNGTAIAGSDALACTTIDGTSDAARLVPCPPTDKRTAVADTGTPPFREGENTVRACAIDFGQHANGFCVTKQVMVDNTPPEVAFRDHQDPTDPEQIRAPASDATSGLAPESATIEYRAVGAHDWLELPTELAGGELRARVDSEAAPPGRYEFRAAIADVAGNAAATRRRAGGEPMVLRFPLKAGARLSAELGNGEREQVVGFRKPGEVSGRLLDAAGAPIAGATVEVVETFAEGSLIDERSREVRTDGAGRYSSALPGGPSREVEVRYGGSRRYRGDSARGLDFDVRGAAGMHPSRRRVRAGRAVVFRGRVRHYFARIPAGGKLVEIQVRSGRRWSTLHEAIGTDAKGRVRLRHRFRGFYTRPVTFTFRLKARREQGWPYRGAARSKRRKVTVVPKR